MEKKGYFHRVKEATSTRFWINNPTLSQARLAIEAGAIGCTTNPSYLSKLFGSAEDFACIQHAVDMLIPHISDDSVLAAVVQRLMVARISDLFMPLYEASGGTEGFVTIQGDPFADTDANNIIEEGLEDRRIGQNIMIKIPVTASGIIAIKSLVEKNIPVLATEVMAVSQAVSICEAYKEACASCGYQPPFFVTHITGILDEYFTQVVTEQHIDLSPEAMRYAGLAIAKREYALLKERRYPTKMIGGGARKLEDFTELVGGDLYVTINWEGTADVLIAQDRPVENRIDVPVDTKLIDELLEKLPDFKRAYEPDGMRVEEFYDYGGVALFRSSFMKGWRALLDLIAQRRRMR